MLAKTLTSRIATNKEATMIETTPTSASVATSLRISARMNEPQVPRETKPSAHEQITSESANSKVAVSPRETTPSAHSGTPVEMSEDQEAEKLNKRAREEDETEESPQSKLKKVVKNTDMEAARRAPAKTEAIDEADVKIGDGIGTDEESLSSEEVAESKEPARKPKTTSKAVPKKKVTTSRRKPACAECKRRKVRCTHNLVEDDTAGQGIPATDPTRDAAVITKRKPTKATEANKSSPVAQADSANNDKESDEERPTKKSSAKKKPAAKQSRAPPERTSTRARKAPERFEELQEQPAPSTSSPRKGTGRVFDPIYITTNSTSRLGRADMYHMLLEDSAWSSLSAEQQATLVSMLPDSANNQRLLQQIRAGEQDTRPQWLRASDVFRDEVAKFKDDLTSGHLAKRWTTAAEQAVVERAAGEYDEWKAKEAELWWGQKSE